MGNLQFGLEIPAKQNYREHVNIVQAVLEVGIDIDGQINEFSLLCYLF